MFLNYLVVFLLLSGVLRGVIRDTHKPIVVCAVIEPVLEPMSLARLDKLGGYVAPASLPCCVPHCVVVRAARPQQKTAEMVQGQHGVFGAKTFGSLDPVIRGEFRSVELIGICHVA